MKRFSIVGQNYLGLDPNLEGTLPGAAVVLVREPGNKFDPNAVMVWINGQHVGYIPSKDAASLSPFIEQTGSESAPPDGMALDQAMTGPDVKAIPAVFVRSPNSAYPMCEIS